MPQCNLILTRLLFVFSESIWTSDLDFVFAADRAYMSNVIGNYNFSETANDTNYNIPQAVAPPGGWAHEKSISVAFVNYAAALLVFSVRYPAVFWYTNKAISSIFAMQLLVMSLESLFSYSGMAVLYKLTYNYDTYVNISVSLSSSVVLVLFIIAAFIMLLSTVAIFEYGSFYFHEKFKILEKKHQQPSIVKKTLIVHSNCQGYVPHSFAMASLVLLAVCKGPLIYNLVSAYRITKDSLVLCSIVWDVCYMVFWIILWLGLIAKQQWMFRILDYVPIDKPVFMIENDHVMRNPSFDSMELREAPRRKKKVRTTPISSSVNMTPSDLQDVDPLPNEGTSSENSDNTANDFVTENTLSELDNGPAMPNGVLLRKSKNRRSAGQRVTFEDSSQVPTNLNMEQRPESRAEQQTGTQVNVAADVHDASSSFTALNSANVTAPSTKKSNVPAKSGMELRDSSIKKDYSKNLRNKCDELYTPVSNHVPMTFEENKDFRTNMSPDRPTSPLRQQDYKPEPRSLSDSKPLQGPISTPINSPLKRDISDKLKRHGLKMINFDNGLIKTRLGPKSPVPQTSLLNKGVYPSTLLQTPSTSSSPDLMPLPDDVVAHLTARPLHLFVKKPEIGRRDSANYSLTSSQETSSNDSDHGLCSQV